jgi:hypothetical protein
MFNIPMKPGARDPFNVACDKIDERINTLENGIRKLRDDWVRGDDKCWKDLVALFKLLPEGFELPEQDTCVELENCRKYINSCHHPGVTYTSPQRRIEELEAENKELKERLNEPSDLKFD